MKDILTVIAESGMAPTLPEGLEPAIKFVNPDFTTHGGFNWFRGPGWIDSPDVTFNPETCAAGGLHVANTVAAAQSGGASPTHALYVGFDGGDWVSGKAKARRVYVAGPIDLVGIIRTEGRGANLRRAYLKGANLGEADLGRADLGGAYLKRAYLERAYLRGAYLKRAYLKGADLRGANLEGANLADPQARGAIR